ncbi:Integrase, catalytic core domain protein [Candidatus Magnetomorum sp. HK-1]|nr:Integrase, catalytic core domain protein [Candidatus Magnetomorum sp. HK-1]
MKLDEKTRNKVLKTFKEIGKIRRTARKCNVSRNTVRKIIRKPETTISSVSYSPRPSKLDPYKAKIDYLVKDKDLSAIRILEEIKPLGYQGAYSILKDFIRTIRPSKSRGASAPIEHSPGHEAQMDWSPHRVIVGGKEMIVHTGSIVLCYSRWLYINFFLDETIESVIGLHEETFMKLGYVPETITYDNMTTVGRHIGPGKEPWLNPTFKAFASNYDFEIIILPPGAKDRHGAVERPFHYIENNCLKGREFNDLEHLKSHGQYWLDNIANVRIHGTLRERPVDRLKREIPFLKPLPTKKYETYKEVIRTVHRDFCIVNSTNRYSVHPDLVGKHAKVRLYHDYLEIWIDNKLAARHVYNGGKYQRDVLPEHEAAYRGSSFQSELLKKAFLRLGEPAKSYFEGLKRERGKAAGYHLSRILKMADRHGSDVVSGAIAHAQRYGVYSADAVIRVINGKAIKKKGQNVVEDVPENIRQWLRSCAVDKQKLSSYDEMINKIDKDEE